MASNILSDKDVNTSSPVVAQGGGKGADAYKQSIKSRMGEPKSKQTYISPSDGLMSPCTAKLSALKHKHLMNAKSKPKSLFAKPEAAPESSQSTMSNMQLGSDVTPESQNIESQDGSQQSKNLER